MSTRYRYQRGPTEALRLTLAAPAGTSYEAPPALTLWLTSPLGQVSEIGPARWTVVSSSETSVIADAELDGSEVQELGEYRLDATALAASALVRYLPVYLPAVDVRRTGA
jgi:hypothetical protein